MDSHFFKLKYENKHVYSYFKKWGKFETCSVQWVLEHVYIGSSVIKFAL
jgi:hypothetical protein